MRRLIQNIILLVLTALLLVGISWARKKAKDELCQRVDVVIVNEDSTAFVTKAGVLAELASAGIKMEGKPMWQIDASHVERELRRSDYLEDVQCVKAKDGVIIIRATQLVPVFRVFSNESESYYVNAAGKRMLAKASFYADVPVVKGDFSPSFPCTKLLPMVQYAEQDSLLRSIVSMYVVRDSDNIFLVPSIYGHVVNMGSVEHFERKFEKLKLFYQKVMPAKGWETYDTISVKWDYQVVATKRKKAVPVVMAYDPADDEQMPDLETMSVGKVDTTRIKKAEVKPAEPKKDNPPQPAPAKTETKKAEPPKTTGNQKRN